MLIDIIIPFITIALAELGDKTQLSLLLLSTKTKKRLQLFFGAMTGFLIVDGSAILLGSWISEIVPEDYLKIFSSAVFILAGIFVLKSGEDGGGKLGFENPALSAFILIFATEWGDKTQIASALFATRYDLLFVFFSVMLALAVLSILAIYLGELISERLDRKKVSRVAGVVFIVIGVSFALV
ncbi:putative membrane protein [Archaeoglobus sulfaticallidus PM70-1]|uniref:Putative membrane protein n=1 Tax=Archaeoglobus sulfaticallidus PM70-1 TaxID=387631 RepID=N0BAH1_9EURY|nr:TMEM165/GDT1 family protein [Archaeoglobus sulfaticallidus]AGK60599.1 putative membrane protein [Archaeoglobus sulfaticallidus PM70-1]